MKIGGQVDVYRITASRALAVISEKGRKLKDFRLETNGQALVEAVRMIPGHKQMGNETKRIGLALSGGGYTWLIALAVCIAACQGTPFRGTTSTLVDLSHPFDTDTIYWPTEDGFKLHVEAAGLTDAGYYYSANRFAGAEHGGTHLDAPIHFAEGHWTVDQIPLEQLIGRAITVDVRAQCRADRNYEIQVSDFEAWETEHGRIEPGTIILLHTGFARHWPNRVLYLGTEALGPEAVAELSFPGLHPDAAVWLTAERGIHAIGIDTASIDRGQSPLFESHRILFAANVPAFENLTQLAKLPPRGFDVFALPMKIGGGTGAPLRAIAVLPPSP